jgi:ubiquinone/menaquinone biosynthesis C-methylase UbiE
MDPEAVGVRGPFDGILMAYGIRNVPDRDLCLARVLRLLAPGGVAAFHEYSVADSRAARLMWNAVSLGVIIPLGYAVTRSAEIFRYLRRSVLDFDGVEEFRARLGRAGFSGVRVETMGGWQRGVVHTFVARRPWGSGTTPA